MLICSNTFRRSFGARALPWPKSGSGQEQWQKLSMCKKNKEESFRDVFTSTDFVAYDKFLKEELASWPKGDLAKRGRAALPTFQNISKLYGRISKYQL